MVRANANGGAALIFGAGPGLGRALARGCAAAGLATGIAARDRARVAELARELSGGGMPVRGYACDVTRAAEVDAVFGAAAEELGAPALVVYNAGVFRPARVLDIDAADFEDCWRVGCLGGFLVGRAAARRMLERGGGTLIFTGATASLRGGAGFANLAVGKFGLRALAQSMARELGPQGIHVAHVIVDGRIAPGSKDAPAHPPGQDAELDADAVAANYLMLHRQPRSAWTQELDLRPWLERF